MSKDLSQAWPFVFHFIFSKDSDQHIGPSLKTESNNWAICSKQLGSVCFLCGSKALQEGNFKSVCEKQTFFHWISPCVDFTTPSTPPYRLSVSRGRNTSRSSLLKRDNTKQKYPERKWNIADCRKYLEILNVAGFPTESPVTRESYNRAGDSLHFLPRQSQAAARWISVDPPSRRPLVKNGKKAGGSRNCQTTTFKIPKRKEKPPQ